MDQQEQTSASILCKLEVTSGQKQIFQLNSTVFYLLVSTSISQYSIDWKQTELSITSEDIISKPITFIS